MRVWYADAGLRDQTGHHAELGVATVAEFRRRGIDTAVLGFSDIEPTLRAALGATPLFRAYPYWRNDGDPQRGWLNAFEAGSRWMREDLARAGIAAEDIVFLPTAGAAQLSGMVAWMAGLGDAQVPRVVMNWGMEPGVDLVASASGGIKVTPKDPTADPTAMLCRHIARQLAALDARRLARLRITYSCPNGATVYQALLGRAVDVIPMGYGAITSAGTRVGKRPIVVGVLGHQRGWDKGYQVVPELSAGLLASHPETRVLIHNSAADMMPEEHARVRAAAAGESRIRLVEGAMDQAGWRDLLDAIDLIVCPYSPRRYQLMMSGIQSEAIANAIPAVVPEGTSLARLSEEFGGTGTTFMRNDGPTVLEATRRLLDDFDRYAQIAAAAAVRWPEHHGPHKIVDRVLELAAAAPS